MEEEEFVMVKKLAALSSNVDIARNVWDGSVKRVPGKTWLWFQTFLLLSILDIHLMVTIDPITQFSRGDCCHCPV